MSAWSFGVSLALAVCGVLPIQSPMRPPADSRREEPRVNRFSVLAKDYVAHPLRGFDVRLVPALTEGGEQSDTGQRALDAIDRDLGDLLDQLPESAHAFLRSVPIFVGVADPVAPCACYHVSPEWLQRNGFDPAKAKGVEIASALTFLSWRGAQPSMLMHELSHAYHDQVLGKPHPGLKKALERARKSGRFDRVVRVMGNVDRHYALTNTDEYFAETTEALFGVNDFFPFVRGELMAVDPEGAALVTELWKAEPQRMQAELSELESKTKDEIARLHRFFVDWFGGQLPATDESFAALEAALSPGFRMITPTGEALTRKELVGRLRGAHGSRKVLIETSPLSVQVLDGVRVLATYEERSTEDGVTRVIVTTALFERAASAPNGLAWVHVHETERRD